MSFLEARMDDRISYGFRVIPRYMTRRRELDSGKQVRDIKWTKAKRRFTAAYMTFTDEQFALLLALFHAVMGSGHGFRFKDWSDYTAELEALGNTPGANSTAVQLIKTYTNGSLSTVRTIVKPVAGTVTMYQDNGSGTFVAKAGTIDTATGLFTPTTNWTSGRALKATFQFDVPVIFSSDELPSTYDEYKAITTDIEVEEDFL